MASVVVNGDVSGAVTLSAPSVAGTVTVTLPSASGTMASIASVNNNGVLYASSSGQPTTSTGFVFDSSNNVGIGTSSPSALLHVSQASTNFQVRVTSTSAANFGAARFYNDAGNALDVGMSGSTASYGANLGVIGTATNNALTFKTNDTERMRIDTSGNLLVGTTSSFSGGNVLGVMAQASGLPAFGLNRTTSTGPIARFYYASSEIGNISTNGSNCTFNSTSDYRLKEDILPMTGALAKVTALKPVVYKWKLTGIQDEGFIAHELAEVCPSAVTGEKDAVDADGNPKYQGIDTSFLVATLTAAIQEQQALITQLQADVEALKGVQA